MSGAAGLEIENLKIAYGGNVAVDNATLVAPLGWITGLIGPNGAGKTTTFNACNGFLRPVAGTVKLFGRDVTSAGPAARARSGMGRTFQRMELCQAMTVRENVALGREAQLVGKGVLRQILAPVSQRKTIAEATEAALDLCSLADLQNRLVATLSTGQRRLVELARVLAGDHRLLLLDEPSSGLDDEETRNFGSILRRVTAQRGTGILLVEHDMSLVMTVCDYIYVLDFGRMIFDGTPAEVRASDVVQKAYLGDADLEVGAGSGA